MKTQTMLLTALGAAPSALAHTAWTTLFVDGVSQGDGVAMRMHQDPAKATFPIASLNSNDMACNVDGTKGVSRVASVKDGATLTFEMRSWPDDPAKPSLDKGHKGPCAVYLKKVDSAVDDQGHGDGWFKLMDNGYDSSNDEWCTDKLINNNGRLSVVLPKGLEGGYYLARPEVLALHAANSGDPQFYPGCAQIFLESTGNLGPEKTVSIPGYVDYNQPSTDFDIYNTDGSKYQVPGPSVAKLTSSAGTASGAQKTQTEGLRPAGCIDENANWCGKEVSSYTDEKSCWASGEECWKQSETCYDTAGPTGHKGCDIWADKCTAIQNNCKSKNFSGPPNKGKDLTPKAETIDIGLILPASGGGVDSTPKPSASEAKASATSAPKSTPAATSASAPKSTAAAYDNEEAAVPTPAESSAKTPKHTTITVPASENGPAPTAAACPAGYVCHTVTSVVTEVEYKTVYVDAKKRRSLHYRRHGHSY